MMLIIIILLLFNIFKSLTRFMVWKKYNCISDANLFSRGCNTYLSDNRHSHLVLKPWEYGMNQRQSSGSYGFYCPKTKMFYSVPNEQMYKELMTLMRQGFATNDTQQSQGCGQQKEVDLNEHYSKLMDEDIENIYNDPLFSKKVDNLELKEYDF